MVFSCPLNFQGIVLHGCFGQERADIWRLGAKPAQKVFAEIADIISKFETVIVGVNQSQYENARYKLSKNVRVIEISYDDAWIRDTGPTFLINQFRKFVRN